MQNERKPVPAHPVQLIQRSLKRAFGTSFSTGNVKPGPCPGNIPFEMTEEQIIDIFKEVGPVVSFKLMFDPKTGKPRGYGFCEFMDAETAKSAIRNLNNYDVGGRTINVGPADKEMPSSHQSMGGQVGGMSLPPPPPKMMAPQMTTQTFGIDSINATLAALNNQQLSEIIINMKNLASTNPTQVNQILQANPALAYALFQSLINMKLVDPNTIQELTNQQKYGIAPTISSQALMQSTASTSQAPPPPPPPMMEDPQQVLARILSMTEDEVNMLPEQNREQIRLIRKQHLGRSMIIPRDGYYQPRLTTRNVGEALKEYEQVINTPRQEGERIYTKFLKLVSIVLPADEENALWAIEDKATKATNLFKLIHGSFSNDKKMITDIFDVIKKNIFAHIDEIEKELSPAAGHFKIYEDPSVTPIIPFYSELLWICSTKDPESERYKLLDNILVIESLIHILVSPDHREREYVTNIIIVLLRNHGGLRIPGLRLLNEKMMRIHLDPDNRVIWRSVEHLIQIYNTYIAEMASWDNHKVIVEITNAAFAPLFTVPCLDLFKDPWARALINYFGYVEMLYPAECKQMMIDFLDKTLQQTFLPMHSSYLKEAAQLEIWAFVILHLPKSIVQNLGTIICHFFHTFKKNPRVMVVQAFNNVIPKMIHGFTSEAFIERFNAKCDYIRVITIFLYCLYSWINDVHEMPKMDSSSKWACDYKFIFPLLVLIFFKTLPLYDMVKGFEDPEPPMNRTDVLFLFDKLEPICRTFHTQKTSRYHDLLNEANEKVDRRRSERQASSEQE